jgi:PAS domain S-box-containing protein
LTHPIEPIVLVATINSLLRARRAEEAQRNSEERFREFFHVSPVGIGLLDEGGVLVECNPALCDLLSSAREDLVRRRLADFAVAEERGDFERALEGTRDGDETQRFRLNKHDGSVAWVELQVAGLPRSTSRMAMVTDITVQREYQAEREQLLSNERAARTEAERLNTLKDQFIAVLGHELRNPLASIVTGIEALGLGETDQKQRQWLRQGIARNAQHLKGLIDDLLDTTRLTHGKLSLKKKTVLLQEIVRQAVDSCRDLIESRSHELSVSVEPKDLEIHADPLRLEQIVINLLTNAAYYTPPGGRISVEARRSGDQLELAVKDTGQGLTEAEKDHIFEAFGQTGRGSHGLGIGLTLVRQLVELHGGEIAAESEGADAGAMFRVTLPLSLDASSPASQEGAAKEGAAPVRTLIVDDNENAALMLQMLLRHKNYATEVAFTGEAALEIARKFGPELILLDIGLPDVSGYEVAKRLREGGLENATIAALSGYAKRAESDDVFDAHLIKPANLDDIQALAASVAARRDARASGS